MIKWIVAVLGIALLSWWYFQKPSGTYRPPSRHAAYLRSTAERIERGEFRACVARHQAELSALKTENMSPADIQRMEGEIQSLIEVKWNALTEACHSFKASAEDVSAFLQHCGNESQRERWSKSLDALQEKFSRICIVTFKRARVSAEGDVVQSMILQVLQNSAPDWLLVAQQIPDESRAKARMEVSFSVDYDVYGEKNDVITPSSPIDLNFHKLPNAIHITRTVTPQQGVATTWDGTRKIDVSIPNPAVIKGATAGMLPDQMQKINEFAPLLQAELAKSPAFSIQTTESK